MGWLGRLLSRVVVAGLFLLAASSPAAALTAYALTNANQLFVFDTVAPQTILQTITITGLQPNEAMAAIDFRPLNGQLYGVTSSGRLYHIHMTTGVATQIGAPFLSVPLPNQQWGMDFDPLADVLRVVIAQSYTVYLNPDTGSLAPGALPSVPDGAPEAAFAHTFSYPGTPSTTVYGVSSAADRLTIVAFFTNGSGYGVGPSLDTNVEAVHGFDIAPYGGDDAYMVAEVFFAERLCRVSLSSGHVSPIAVIGSGATPIRSLALYAPAVLMWAAVSDVVNGFVEDRLVSFMSPRPDLILSTRVLGRNYALIDAGAIDVRPSTGELYAFSRYTDDVHLIDAETGDMPTFVGTPVPLTVDFNQRIGADFDPATDALRLIGPAGQNLSFNPATGQTAADTVLSPAGQAIAELAYTSTAPGVIGSTAYAVNMTDQRLYRIGGPGGTPSAGTGQLAALGFLGFTPTSEHLGFEIPAAGGNAGFLLAQSGGPTLRSVDLASGESRPMGNLPLGSYSIGGLTSAPPGHVRISAATAATVGESAGNALITVERVHGKYGPISVDYAITAGTATAGTDFTLKSGTLIFLDRETTKTFTVPILPDTIDEPDETLTITLSSPLLGAAIVAPAIAVLTIVDDDLPPEPPPTDPPPTDPPPTGGPVVRTYLLAEGATGSFFQTDILLANPNASPAPARVTFLRDAGAPPIVETLTLPPTSHRRIAVSSISGLEAAAFSTMVESLDGLPLAVERTMTWDATQYGAHTETAVAGANTTWYFAEGAQGFFHTFLLLANTATSPNVATVEFLIEGRTTPVTKQFDLDPSSRLTVDASAIPELADQAFGMIVTFAQPGVAERAMYFGDAPLFTGGHESVGATSPSTNWFHAEGATGPFFDTFLLLANPGGDPAEVTLRYLPADGAAVISHKTIPAHSRLSVNIELEDPSLSNVPVATEVTSDRPIVSERSMYWPGTGSWHEAHNSLGVTSTAQRWALAEGRVGGPQHHQTYILLANPHDQPAHVTITYLRDDGTTVAKTYEVAATSRFNVNVNALVPELADEGFGASITADRPIFVERAMYADANGVVWAAGTVSTATRLP